ncbi:MAG: flavodoxin-dependent (E)-4-hydroxy-3-methylbut-2-enyl-diphosphate synthase, partial [Nevskiales bacterium]
MLSQHIVQRRRSRQIRVGRVPIGGDAPIAVQTMTSTDTEDVAATVAQIRACAKAGADLVRVSVPTLKAAEAFREIKQQVGYFPLIADIHFNYKCAIATAEGGADCLRINPGNIGGEKK